MAALFSRTLFGILFVLFAVLAFIADGIGQPTAKGYLKKASKSLSCHRYSAAVEIIMNNSDKARTQILELIARLARREMRNFIKERETTVVTAKANPVTAESFSWKEAMREFQSHLPILHLVLSYTLTNRTQIHKVQIQENNVGFLVPGLGIVLAMLSKMRSRRFRLIPALVGMSLYKSGCSSLVNPYIAAQETLWRQGEGDVVIYRVPLLSYTPRGRLLAIAEARKYSADNAGPKFIAIRRSLDGSGDKWEATRYIVDDGYLVFDGLNLGNVIVDDEKGVIFIMYTVCYHHDGCGVTSTVLVKSADDGITWSVPVNVSEQVGTMSFAPGPGFGFQKKLPPNKGRLVSCGHNGNGGPLWGLHCLLSDDDGMTWRWGGWIKAEGQFIPTECQAVELPDGSVMVNIRNNNQYECHCRLVARSYDGAETFPTEDINLDEALIEPSCAAGLLYHRDVLFFTNPKNATERVNLTLQWSYDNGTTWASELQIWDQASGHSTMTAHPGSSQYIFLLIEKGVKSYTESMEFIRVSLYD